MKNTINTFLSVFFKDKRFKTFFHVQQSLTRNVLNENKHSRIKCMQVTMPPIKSIYIQLAHQVVVQDNDQGTL